MSFQRSWKEEQPYESYVDALHDLQGNLVNIANNTGIQVLQRQTTSLHPNASSFQFVVRLTKENDPKGTVQKEIVMVEKFLTATACDDKILQKGPSVESKGIKEKDTSEELSPGGSLSASSEIYVAPEADFHEEEESMVEFNADYDEGNYESNDNGQLIQNEPNERTGTFHDPQIGGNDAA
jgi:hypothetical protein